MGKFAIAKQLAGKRIITNEGDEIGRLVDVIINEVTGKMESLIIEPNPDNGVARSLKKEEGHARISYGAVLAVSDHIIVDKKGLAA